MTSEYQKLNQSYGLISSQYSLGICLLLILMSACAQPPSMMEIPPPPNDPNLSAANIAFTKGDWKTLRALLSRLPGEGVHLSESIFYQTVIMGLDKPKKSLDQLKKLQLSSSAELRRRATLYRLIFKARSGDCLLTEGPLRRVYWPKAKTLAPGTRTLLEETLRACDEEEQAHHARFNELINVTKGTKETRAPSSAITQDTAQLPSKASNESKESTSVPINLNALTAEQRRGVSPYLQLWLPLNSNVSSNQKRRTGLNILLSESTPLLIEERESQGERLEIERLDISVEGEESVSTRIAEMRSEVDALIAVTPNRDLHQAVLAAVNTQQRPLFIFTPFKLQNTGSADQDKKVKMAPIWRIFPDQGLIAKGLIQIALNQDTQGIGLLIPEGRQGANILELFKKTLGKDTDKLLRHRTVTPDSDWTSIATEVRQWPVDTLIFATLPNLTVTSLTTHLASKGIWSAHRHQFSETLELRGDQVNQDLFRRFILWPSAYEQGVLDQAGRYLEGARTVTPIVRESDNFQALDRRLRKEVGRGADLLDAIMLDVLSAIDEAIRVSEVKQLEFQHAFQKLRHQPKYVSTLDFTQAEPMTELFILEVHDQQFKIVKSPSSQKTLPIKEVQSPIPKETTPDSKKTTPGPKKTTPGPKESKPSLNEFTLHQGNN